MHKSHVSEACAGGTCIPQPGTSQQLFSLGDRLMYRLWYRKFNNHEALFVNHSVNPGPTAAGVRWFELRTTGTGALDPVDDCTFWYTNEYLSSNGTFNWHTRIGSFSWLAVSKEGCTMGIAAAGADAMPIS